MDRDVANKAKDGRVAVNIPVPSNANCLKINVCTCIEQICDYMHCVLRNFSDQISICIWLSKGVSCCVAPTSNSGLCNEICTVMLKIYNTLRVYSQTCWFHSFCYFTPLKLRLSDSSQSCGGEQVCIYPAPMYSPTKSFLQLEDVSRRSPLTVREMNVTSPCLVQV